MIKKILVPIDGSDCSMKALERAKSLGIFYKADLTITTIIDNTCLPEVDFRQDMVNSIIEEGRALLQNASETVANYPHKVTTTYRVGDIADEIITMAEENNFDLIVIGSRGLGMFTRSLLGGVSHKVVSHVPTSVYVVK